MTRGRIKVAAIVGAMAVIVVGMAKLSTRFVADDAAQRPTFISIGTGGPTGVYFIAGQSICRMLHKAGSETRPGQGKGGLSCSAPTTSGSIQNLEGLRLEEFDFAVVQSDWQYHAFNGTDRFAGKRFTDLRALFSLHAEPFQIVVGRDSGIGSWEDLKGKRVNIGNPGSGQRATMEVLLKAHGTAINDFATVTELTSTEQSKALCDDKIDAYAYTVGIPNTGDATAADICGARIIELSGATERSLVSKLPYFSTAVIPQGTYKTTTGDVATLGVRATVVTAARIPAEITEQLTRAVFENLDEFKKLHPSFGSLQPAEMIREGLSAPLHPGALGYYRKKGWM